MALMFNGSQEGWPGGLNNGAAWTAESVLRMLAERRPLAVLLAWDEGRVAGCCNLYEYPEDAGTAMYVGMVNVATAFQGRGLGRDLLREALHRARERGYTRLDLYTWPGNMRAIPLYKKSGYFWEPETDVHMRNFLPLLLGLPVLAGFWQEVDWYSSQVRDLSVQEDLYLEGKMRVYPYEFRQGERFVRALIDATARGLTLLETEQWKVACTVEDRRVVYGGSLAVRWQVENRTGAPLALGILALASDGLQLRLEQAVTVQEHYEVETTLQADANFRQPGPGQRSPRVSTICTINGQPIRLETGLAVVPPFECHLEPARVRLLPGRPQTLRLRLRSNLDLPGVAHLRLAPSPELDLPAPGGAPSGRDLPPIALPADGYAGLEIQVMARSTGPHVLQIWPRWTTDGPERACAPFTLALPAVGPGDLLPISAPPPGAPPGAPEDEIRLESIQRRLVVAPRGRFEIEDAISGEQLAQGSFLAGPPFSWRDPSTSTHTVRLLPAAGSATVIVQSTMAHLPDVTVEHALCFDLAGVVRVTGTVTGLGTGPHTTRARLRLGRQTDRYPTAVLPTSQGLLTAQDMEFPDWTDLAESGVGRFHETWLAQQGQGGVAGIVWARASDVGAGKWSLEVTGESIPTEGAENHVRSTVYLYAGPGDWRQIRDLWRTYIRPEADPADPVAREVVALYATAPVGALLLPGRQILELSSDTERAASGTLAIDAPPGWTIEPGAIPVSDLRFGAPHLLEVEVSRAAGTVPTAAPLTARWRSERQSVTVLAGAVLDPGSGDTARISRVQAGDHAAVTVENGYLRFSVVPGYLASVTSLVTVHDQVEQVHSSFPQPREFGWMRPWYGGIHPVIYAPGPFDFPDPRRLYEETFSIEEWEETGAGGRRWRGVRLQARLTGKDLPGLEIQICYLTLPGSNLLALRGRVRNSTTALLPIHAGIMAYLQPGGTTEGVELIAGSGLAAPRLLRAHRTEEAATDGWAAAHDPRTGTTLGLVGSSVERQLAVKAIDWGHLGGHAGAVTALHLPPGQERGFLCYLVVARNEEEARAYHALTTTRHLL